MLAFTNLFFVKALHFLNRLAESLNLGYIQKSNGLIQK